MPIWPRDHPRACGEHYAATSPTLASAGSSPRLRGTHRHEAAAEEHRGIIPALAGNTASIRSTRSRCGDHPRACGEHVVAEIINPTASGSSPRLRGTQERERVKRLEEGIIPALAGNTADRIRGSAVRRELICNDFSSSLWQPFIPNLLGNKSRIRHMHIQR